MSTARATARAPLFDNRDELLAFAGGFAAASAMAAQAVRYALRHGHGTGFDNFAGISAICWLALLIVLEIVREPAPAPRWRRADRPIAMAAIALALLPSGPVAAIALAGIALWLALTSAAGTRGRRAGLVLFALTGTLVWGRLVLALEPQALLAGDAWLAGRIAHVPVRGNLILAGEGVIIEPACSSLHNISLALVLWTALVARFVQRITPLLVISLGAAVLATAALNLVRIAALARYPAWFDWLHDGTGAVLFGLASLAVSGLLIGCGVIDAARREA